MPKNLEQDYIDLFSYVRKGHMAKYVYMHRPDTYDELITQHAYYPFRMECNLIAEKADQICRTFRNVNQVMEIGPGSSTPMRFKSIPFLEAFERQSSIATYIAMDSNYGFAKQACELIKQKFNTIKTEAIEIEFLSEMACEKTKCKWDNRGNKLMFGFGQSIFSNNNDEDVAKFVSNISILLNEGDYLLFGADTTRDEKMLDEAYNSKVNHELLLNTLYHLKNEINPNGFEPKQFDSIYKWNQKNYTIEHFLRSTHNQQFKIGNQEIIIKENQNFNVLNSRKMDIRQIESFLNKSQIKIKEIVTLENYKNYSMIIAQKMSYNGEL